MVEVFQFAFRFQNIIPQFSYFIPVAEPHQLFGDFPSHAGAESDPAGTQVMPGEVRV